MQACVVEVEDQLHELVNPKIVRADRRRPGPRGLPVDPGLRRLRHPARAGLGRRPGSPRPEDQGRRVGAARAGAPARARPPRRQAVHRLPRLDGRADGGRPRRTRTTRRSARRRAPSRDGPGGPAARACGPSSSAAARSGSSRLGASTATPMSISSASSRRRPAGRTEAAADASTVIDGARRGARRPDDPSTRAPARTGGDRRGPGARARAPRARRLRPDRAGRVAATSGTGLLNLHPSLLPRHRGATPIPATIRRR